MEAARMASRLAMVLGVTAMALAVGGGEAECVTRCFGPGDDVQIVMFRSDFVPVLPLLALAVMSLYSIAVAIERAITFNRAAKQSREFESRTLTALYYRRLDEALAVTNRFPHSPVAVVVRSSLRESLVSGSNPALQVGPSVHGRHSALVQQTVNINDGLWQLAAIGWAAPLLGAFVTALELSRLLATSPVGDNDFYFARQLVEAMPPTILGLFVGGPAIFAHRFLATRAEQLLLEATHLSLGITATICELQHAAISDRGADANHTRIDGSRSTPTAR